MFKHLCILFIALTLVSPDARSQCTAPTSSITNNTNCTVANGSISFNSPAPTANYLFSIDGGVTFGAAGQTVFTGLFGGTYQTVSKQIATGCISSATPRTITNPVSPANPTSTVVNNTNCTTPSGSITFTAPTPLANYQFSVNGGITYGAPGVVLFSGLTGANYATMVRTVSSTCASATTTKILTDPTIAAPVSATTAVTNCLVPDGIITFTAQSGFVFSTDGGATFGAVGQTVFPGLNSGSYVTRSKQTATGCLSATANKTVGSPAVTVPASTVANVSTCGVPNGSITFTAPTPLGNYTFSKDGGLTFAGAGQSSFTGLSAGTYATVAKLTSTGCASAVVNKTVSNQAVATPTATIVNITNCNTPNGSITFTAPIPVANYQYSVDGGLTYGTQGQTVFANLSAGTYSIVAKLVSSGCSSQTPGTKILTSATVVAPTSTVTTSSCSAATGTITFTAPTPTANFSFSVDNGVTFGTPGQTLFTGLAAGSYVTKTKSAAGCISAASTNKTISNAATTAPTTAAGTNPTTCSTPNGSINFTGPTPLANYQFSVDGGTNFGPAGVTAFPNLAGGSYVTKAKLVSTGCNSANVNKVLTNPVVTVPTATRTNVTNCTIQDGSITFTAPTPLANYQFSIDGGATFGTAGQSIFPNLVEGVYTPVGMLISTTCLSAAAANLTITKPAEAGADKSICQFQTATMTATALATATWTAMAGNPAVTAITNATSATTSITGFSTTGVYTYVWGSLSCSDTVTVTVGDCLSPIVNSSVAFLFQSNAGTGTNAVSVNIATGAQTTINTDITGTTETINAIGYNVTDGEIWGSVVNGTGSTAQTGSNIARIGDDGIPHYFFIPGLYNGGYTVGDVDNNGVLYLYLNNQTQIFRVDVNPASPTFLTLLAPVLNTTAINFSDWAFNPIDGQLYSVGLATPHKLYRTNPVTGVMTAVGNVTGNATFTSGLFGAAYMDASGNLYVGDNVAGGIYKINTVQNVTGNTTASLRSQGQISSGNDGAFNYNSCIMPEAGNDMSICLSSPVATMAATQVSGLKWVVMAGNPGTATITNPDSANTTITDFSVQGTYNFLWADGTDCFDTASVFVYNCKTDTVIVFSCDTCSQVICNTENPDIPVTDATTHNTCGLSGANALLGSVSVDANGCALWTPNGTQTSTDTITTCITSCNGAICDTTYIIILPLSNNPLPLNLISFKGSTTHCQTQLEWRMADDKDADFGIERMTPGQPWTNIATIPAVKKDGYNDYSYVDMDVPKGHVLYRLKISDWEGFVYSPIVAINNNCTNDKIFIFPNPSNEQQGINMTMNSLNKVDYEVVDQMGRLVRTGTFVGQTSIKGLKPGAYVVTAHSALLNVVQKIIIR